MFIKVENYIISKSQIKFICAEKGIVFIFLIDEKSTIELTNTSIYDLNQLLK